VIPALQEQPPELFEEMNRALIESAAKTGAVDYVRATAQLRERSRRIVRWVEQYDLVLTPTLAQPPPEVGATIVPGDPWESFRRAGRFTAFTQVANITGLPAVSLPLSWSDEGLPIGVQLTGRPADEATLIRVSAQLEQARPWRARRPPVS
jgi:amidase